MATHQRPDLPGGYLGPQPKFQEFGMSTISHKNPEITVTDNSQLEVFINTTQRMKLTSNLIHCATSKEYPEYVFTQTKGPEVSFVLGLPEAGYYKLQLFALPAGNPSKSCPGVYNYLIHCVRATHAIHPFPTQYAQWKDGCYLGEPLVLHKDAKLVNVYFMVAIANARKVVVVCKDEWTNLEKQYGDVWEGNVSGFEKYRGKNEKVTLNTCYVDNDTKYSTLLEYRI